MSDILGVRINNNANTVYLGSKIESQLGSIGSFGSNDIEIADSLTPPGAGYLFHCVIRINAKRNIGGVGNLPRVWQSSVFGVGDSGTQSMIKEGGIYNEAATNITSLRIFADGMIADYIKAGSHIMLFKKKVSRSD